METSIYSIYIDNLLGRTTLDSAKIEIVQQALHVFLNNLFEELLQDDTRSTSEELSEVFKDMGGWTDEDFVLKKHNTLEALLIIPSWFDIQADFVHYYNQLLTEKWHHKHEDLLTLLISFRSETSVPYIETAIKSNLKYLHSSDTNYAGFIRKAMWVLADINTNASVDLLKRYSESENPVIRQYADEQIRWMNGDKNTRYMG